MPRPASRCHQIDTPLFAPPLFDEPVGRVVDERGDAAEAVGLAELVAREVVGVARDGAEGVGLGDESVEAVVGVAGDVAGGVGDARGVAPSVVGGGR